MIVQRDRGRWIIDFGSKCQKPDAAFYEAPFSMCRPREASNVSRTAQIGAKSGGGIGWSTPQKLRRGIGTIQSIIVTAGSQSIGFSFGAIPRSCPTSPIDRHRPRRRHHLRHPALPLPRALVAAHGHLAWVGNDPRYTPTTTFETFPFPEGLTPDIPAAAYAADPRAQSASPPPRPRLNDLRENWLNPPDWCERVPGGGARLSRPHPPQGRRGRSRY